MLVFVRLSASKNFAVTLKCDTFGATNIKEMKNIILPLLALMAFSCADNNLYTIRGAFEDDFINNGTIVRMLDIDGRAIDSTVVDSGTFIFTGHTSAPELRYIAIDGHKRIIVCEPGQTNILFSRDMEAYISGTELNGRINAIDNYIRSQYIKYLTDSKNAQTSLRGARRDSVIDRLKKETRRNISEYYGRQVEEHKDNIVSGYAMLGWSNMLEAREIDSALNTIAHLPSKELPPVIKTRNRKYNAARSAVGQPFVDIAGIDVDGQRQKLAGMIVKGKPTILFFWASWCEKCMNDTAIIKTLTNKYGQLSPRAIGINVFDKKSDFNETTALWGMSWPNIYVHDNSATDAYSVAELPFAVLLDRDGKIAMRTDHTADIESALDAMTDSVASSAAPLPPSDSTLSAVIDSCRHINQPADSALVIKELLKLDITEKPDSH